MNRSNTLITIQSFEIVTLPRCNISEEFRLNNGRQTNRSTRLGRLLSEMRAVPKNDVPNSCHCWRVPSSSTDQSIRTRTSSHQVDWCRKAIGYSVIMIKIFRSWPWCINHSCRYPRGEFSLMLFSFLRVGVLRVGDNPVESPRTVSSSSSSLAPWRVFRKCNVVHIFHIL